MHHRTDDSADDIDMDIDHRFRPSGGGRIILLGDGTEISADSADNEMFDNDDEDKDLESQVNKFNKDDNSREAREGTPGPTTAQVTESPSSVQTEGSDAPAQTSSETRQDTTAAQSSEK